MRVPGFLLRWLQRRAIATFIARAPDRIIGPNEDRYLERWHLVRRNRLLNVYLHRFCRSDDDRALHDHPWLFNLSIVLCAGYIEETPATNDPRGARRRRSRSVGSLVLRLGSTPHRVERDASQPLRPVTIFVTGPVVRAWGFWCPQGWRHWRDFTAAGPTGRSQLIGRGCADDPETLVRRAGA